MTDKLENFRKIAVAFADGLKAVAGVEEIAVFGSVAGGDRYPSDVDVAIILSSLSGLAQVARHKRKVDNSNYLDVFLFDGRKFMGNVCHRKDCPGQSMECYQPGCGRNKFIRVREGLVPDPARWFKTPLIVLQKHDDKSVFLDWQKDILRSLGLTAPEAYQVRGSITEKCRQCGSGFEINPGEQKYFESMGFKLPKRCQPCRDGSRGLEEV
ncbi:MAG: hypothetical protein A2X28_07275 [Elusimicrobia bacterium GWA2_56_46]|nr:MAG: hypothetical protein A2X28_07275 [Elusimicrobia bacterium GWA2_56_46]OGR54754.1 MAG: hypothetical protein A2X39_10715 [Elusimicrobia bacterium GWC2_56_31]